MKAVTTIVLLFLGHLTTELHANLPLGTGSSRWEETRAAQELENIVQDTEHIKDDFEDLFTQSELDEMDHDMIAFTWFTAHNSDGDDGLDGLELLKAFRHATHNHNDAYENASGDVNESGDNMTFDESIAFVDSLLHNHDSDGNGLLEYPEFMLAFASASESFKPPPSSQ